MEKKEINIVPKVNKIIQFQGDSITIKPYISNESKFNMIYEYVTSLFESDDIVINYMKAQNKLIFKIIDECCLDVKLVFTTNDDENKIIIENIFSSGFWELVKNNIENYDSFIEELEYAISFAQKENYSTKKILTYITDWVNKELSSDKLQSIVKEIDKQKESLSEVFPIIKVDEQPKKVRKSKKALLE